MWDILINCKLSGDFGAGARSRNMLKLLKLFDAIATKTPTKHMSTVEKLQYWYQQDLKYDKPRYFVSNNGI